MTRLMPRIFLTVPFAKCMADLMISHCFRNIHCLVTGFLQSQGKIKVFGTEWTEERIESMQMLEDIRPHHHCTTTGDTGFGHIILTRIRLAKPDRSYPPEHKTDARPAAVIDEASVMHEAQFGLCLP